MVIFTNFVLWVVLFGIVLGQYRRPIYKTPPADEEDLLYWVSRDENNKPEFEEEKVVLDNGIRLMDLDRYEAFPENMAFPDWDSPKGRVFEQDTEMETINFGDTVGDPKWSFWWDGPNVCIDRDETTEYERPKPVNTKESEFMNVYGYMDPKYMEIRHEEPIDVYHTQTDSQCMEVFDSYECKSKAVSHYVRKTYQTTYKCCYGYKRNNKQPGCVQVELQSLTDTLRDLDAGEFMSMMLAERVGNLLRYNNTLFVPYDKATIAFLERMSAIQDAYTTNLNSSQHNRFRKYRRNRRFLPVPVERFEGSTFTTRDLMTNHIVPEIIEIGSVENNMVYRSYLKGSTIRLNIYPGDEDNRLITLNCIPVKETGVPALNGYIYIVDNIIPPATARIIDIILRSNKLKIFKKVLTNPKMIQILNRKDPYTLLLPTDKAFDKLDELTKTALFTGNKCGQTILKNLIIPRVLCTKSIRGYEIVRNLEGHRYKIERRGNDKMFIDGKFEILKPDVMASNGVIQVTDTLIMTDTGLVVSQVMEKYNLTFFHKLLLSFPGLLENWNSLENKTFFVPNNDAFANGITQYMEKRANDNSFFLLLNYYISPGHHNSKNFIHNQVLDSELEEHSRINLYSNTPIFNQSDIEITKYTWNCAEITKIDIECCGAVVHAVDNIILPPVLTIYQIIQTAPEFSILRHIIQGTKIVEILNNTKVAVTFLAPTNDVLQTLNEKDINIFLADKKKTTEVMLNHILRDVMCCHGVGPAQWHFKNSVQTLAEQPKRVSRNSIHQISVGSATITECDVIATNGVIHYVNNLLMPKKRFQFTEIGLFDFNV